MKLLEPARLGPVEVRNRMVMAPMENLYNHADGSVSQTLIDYYAERARGGVGTIVVQNTAIDPTQRSAPGQTHIGTAHMIAGFTLLAEAIKSEGAAAVLQIGHGGRQSNPDNNPDKKIVAPSPIASDLIGEVPRELATEEIPEIQAMWARAAGRAQAAGFDGVEVHGAHGYLISQFVSPKTNQRTDGYGGDLAARARFPLEVLAQVRETVGPDYLVGFRFSADEFVEGGLGLDEALDYAQMIVDSGHVDYLSVSAATYESLPELFPVMYYGRGHLRHLAAAVRERIDSPVPVMAVGSLDSETGEDVLQRGEADFAAFGRPLLADPDLPAKLAEGRADDVRPCIQCNYCISKILAGGQPVRCAVNPAAGREGVWRLEPLEEAERQRVLVVGGGIAGIEAARTHAARGHQVRLVEASNELGGQLHEASAPAFKAPLAELRSWAERQLERHAIDVELGVTATPELIANAEVDKVVLALGADDQPLEADGDVVSARAVLRGEASPGDRVVIVGGGTTGCETALHLAETKGATVTLVEQRDDVLVDAELTHRWVMTDKLAAAGVTVLAGQRFTDVSDGEAIVADVDGHTSRLPADTVISAVGYTPRPVDDLLAAAKDRGLPVQVIGDSSDGRRIPGAFEDAWRVTLQAT